MATDPDRLLKVKEWADLIGVSEATAYRRIAAGEIERHDIGSGRKTKTRITLAAHRKYLAEHAVPGPRSRRGRAA